MPEVHWPRDLTTDETEAIERLNGNGATFEWNSHPRDWYAFPGHGYQSGRTITYEDKAKPLEGSGFAVGAFDPKFDDKSVVDICRIRKIRDIRLDDSSVTDKGVAKLAGCAGINCLTLGGTKITDAGIKSLSNLTTLQYLSVARTRATGDGIAALRSLPDLYLVDACRTETSDLVLDRGFPRLQGIWLNECPLKRVRICKLPQLHALSIGGDTCPTVDLEELPELREVSVYFIYDASRKAHVTLRNLPKLEFVMIYGLAQDEDLRAFHDLPHLRIMNLGWTALSDRGLDILAQFPAIEELTIGVNAAGEKSATPCGFNFLRKLPKLRTLTIKSDLKLGTEQFADLRSLVKLSLSGKCVNETTLTAVATVTTVKELALHNGGRQYADNEIEALASTKSLRKIVFDDGWLDGSQIAKLRAALPKFGVVLKDGPPSPSVFWHGDCDKGKAPREIDKKK